MASCLCHPDDPNPSQNNNPTRRPKDGENDRPSLSTSNLTDRVLFQLELDMREQDLLVLECSFHSDAQGAAIRIAIEYQANSNGQATTPVAVLCATWGLGVAQPNMKVLFNVSFIVIGVIIASFGEIKFVLTGFLYQFGGIVFEAIRLVMVQRLLSSAEYKMDPLVSLYYFAPVCATMNGLASLVLEVPQLKLHQVYDVGFTTLLANAMIAFLLNVSVVFLVSYFNVYALARHLLIALVQIGKTSSLVLTLCGVLKDILLVCASMLIWGTPVSALQFFGYSIALGGLIYYKLGTDNLKDYISHLGRSWAEYGVKHPAMRKMIIFGAVLLTIFILLGGLAPTYAADTVQESVDKLRSLLGGAVAGKTSGS